MFLLDVLTPCSEFFQIIGVELNRGGISSREEKQQRNAAGERDRGCRCQASRGGYRSCEINFSKSKKVSWHVACVLAFAA